MPQDPLLLTEQERILQRAVHDFADNVLAPRAGELDEREEFPWENFRGLADMGLLGIGVPEAYGGAGGGFRESSIATEEIARGCAATSVIYGAHLSLATQTIARFGSDALKARFLPALAQGRRVAAFALTEPEAGSDVASLATAVTRKGDDYVLNGSKLFITNGDVASVYVVFATHDRALRTKGIDCLVLEKGTPGLAANRQSGKLGMRASSTAEVVFQDAAVPVENRIGEEGTGFYAAMQILESSRITIAAQCAGIAQACLEAAARYAGRRHAFGQPIAGFQAIQWMLADTAVEVDAARLLTRRAAVLKDMGLPHGTESAMAKLFASEAANRAADRAVQVHGGYGYFRGAPVERYFRDARVTEIYEGTSEVQRLIISRAVLQALASQ
ncbi:MAG: acyl-CoA dehydrogenase family protein [Chloroflexi bacterium]|nr:acyl-CoA dehydrogenase family protein [Chloroflexota bacterium]